jgi:C4-dicarboxylate-specific signal transduction histidine kinase
MYLASDVGTLIDQLKYFTTLVVIIIGIVALIIAFLVFSWNKQLEKTVVARTAQLKNANDSLACAVETQVISNLLDNAIKFAKEIATMTTSGNVAVSVLSEPEKFGDDNDNDNKKEVVISVKDTDTGTGIDPEIFPKLFSKFATKS